MGIGKNSKLGKDTRSNAIGSSNKTNIASNRRKSNQSSDFNRNISELWGRGDSDLESSTLGAASPEGGESTSYRTSLGKGQSYTQKTHDRFNNGTSSVKVYKGDGIKYKSKDVFDEGGKLIRSTVKLKQRVGKSKINTRS